MRLIVECPAMERIVVAGAGATGASIAYHLARRGAARRVVLCDRGTVASGSTGKALGGVRQQFSTAAEVQLARASVRFFEELGPAYFQQVGYLFLATTEAGLDRLEARCEQQAALGVPVEPVDRARVEALAPGVATADVLGGVFGPRDGLSDPAAVTRRLVRDAVALGLELREQTDARDVAAGVLVVACGPWSGEVAAAFGVELPLRPLQRQLLLTTPVEAPERLPLVIEAESGFHFRRRDRGLLLAMADDPPRFGWEATVDERVLPDRLARLARRYPPAAGARVRRAWAGLYDMTPDAHPIVDRIGDGLLAACGFSGHGFMQAPAVGRAVAELVLDGESSFDLSPYRLDRFAAGAAEPEELVL